MYYEDILVENLPSVNLQWQNSTPAQLAFMRRVYDINLARSSASGTFTADVPAAELAAIEGGYMARTAAASACVNMFAAIRAAIAFEGIAARVGLTSAYRSASHQFRLWQQYFPGYYADTATARQSQASGEHGEGAAQLCAAHVRARIATPGYSNHNNGLAIDLLNVKGGVTLENRARPEKTRLWRDTWLWRWLTTNAATYNYYQNTNIDEPWHWEYRAVVAVPAEYWMQPEQETVCGCGEVNQDERTTRLAINEVEYLSFEGGGGKGYVYIGAVKALQNLGVITHSTNSAGQQVLNPRGQIKGVSGASAGAITALLISLGYNATAIEGIMSGTNFNRFYDLPTIPRQRVETGGCARSTAVDRLTQKLTEIISGIPVVGSTISRAFSAAGAFASYLSGRINAALAEQGPAAKLIEYPIFYGDNLIEDWGVFSGCEAFRFLQGVISSKRLPANVTFSQHFAATNIKLVVAGTNLETRTSFYFSKDSTPDFPVALAVRISMSLPIIFKPVVFRTAFAGAPAGVWVDGGVKDNLPMRVFEADAPGALDRTFAVRLSQETTTVNGFMDYTNALLNTMMVGLNSTSGLNIQTVQLDIGSLTTTNFNPSSSVVGPLIVSAERSVMSYFGR